MNTERVRLAGPEDLDGCFEMRHLLHRQDAMKDALGNNLPLDEEKVKTALRRALFPKLPDGTFAGNKYPAWLGVIGPSNAIEGGIYLSLEQLWYSNAPILLEIFLLVHPKYRRSTNCLDLIDWSKKLSDKLSLRPLLIGVMSKGRESAKNRLYRRKLGEPTGSVFIYTGRGL